MCGRLEATDLWKVWSFLVTKGQQQALDQKFKELEEDNHLLEERLRKVMELGQTLRENERDLIMGNKEIQQILDKEMKGLEDSDKRQLLQSKVMELRRIAAQRRISEKMEAFQKMRKALNRS